MGFAKEVEGIKEKADTYFVYRVRLWHCEGSSLSGD